MFGVRLMYCLGLSYFKMLRVKLCHKGIGNQMKSTDTSVVLVWTG